MSNLVIAFLKHHNHFLQVLDVKYSLKMNIKLFAFFDIINCWVALFWGTPHPLMT